MLLEGMTLGHYRLVRLIGQGGFADVYLAEHLHLGTEAAIKVLSMQLAHESLESFRQEARTIARLVHPHIVRILDFGVEGNIPYLVMDYVPNGSLRGRHPKGTRLPIERVANYVKQLADALQFAHNQKIIHRDIKPENMLIGSQGTVFLSDFGIAVMAQSSRYQGVQEMAGTIAYMAPEQIQGKPRPASDQYSLGVVVYEWLTGDRPFAGSLPEIVGQHLSVSPPSLREKVSPLSSAIDAVVLRSLAKKPEERFPSLTEFAQAFQQAMQYQGDPRTTLSLSSEEALSATTRTPTLPDGRNREVTIPPENQDGQLVQVEGDGEASYENGPRGPLPLTIHLQQPERTSALPVWGPEDLPTSRKDSNPSDPKRGEQTMLAASTTRQHDLPSFSLPAETFELQVRAKHKGRLRGRALLLLVLVVLLIISGLIGYATVSSILATDNVRVTATAQTGAIGTAQIIATSHVQATATRTAFCNGYNTTVANNGVMFGFDATHSHFNPYECTLSPATASSLTLAWSYSTGEVDSSPAVANGIVYIGSVDGSLYAIDAHSGFKLWSFSTGGFIDSSPAVANGVVYIASSDGFLYAIDARSGTKLWSFLMKASIPIPCSPVIANGIVYVGTEDYSLYALDARSGTKLWSFPTGSYISSSPAVADGVVYVGSYDHSLYALDAHSGSKLWSFSTGGAISASPAVINGIVYVVSNDHNLYALNAHSGSKLWSSSTGNYMFDISIASSPALANDIVYVGSDDHNLYALDVHSGSKLWSFPTGDIIKSSPTVANGVVFVGSDDHNLYALDAHSGSKLWSFPTGDIIRSSPAVVNGMVYVGSFDGKLYAFHLPGGTS